MQQRYYSLDVFRGATVAFMILVNNPGNWRALYAPLKHAAWHGVTPTDLVFPFFLFAVGNALAFVMPKLRQQGDGAFWKKTIKRGLLIFLIGLLLNWWPFISWQEGTLSWKAWAVDDQGVRIMGVLQRIALCYFFAAIMIYYFKTRTLLLLSALLLLVYWLVCVLAVPSDPFSLEHWFGTEFDTTILGMAHMYRGEGVPFEPEGIASTLASIVQVVIGYLAGLIIRNGSFSTSDSGIMASERLNKLLIGGLLLAFAGLVWSLSFPLNKKIWTSSFTLYTGGLAALVLGVFIWFIEFRKMYNPITRFFEVFGKNPLFVFVISALIPKTLALIRIPSAAVSEEVAYRTPLSWFYQEICVPVGGEGKFGSLLYACCFLGLLWAISYWMDRKQIYIKV